MLRQQKELYEFLRFRLDVSERLLQRDGKRLPLTDKAFDTLCVLVRHGGELVGKDQLMAEVWPDAVVEENNLDQKISMLRQALGGRGKNKNKEEVIETVRGYGYRFLPKVRLINSEGHKPAGSTQLKQIHPASAFAAEPVETRRSGNILTVAKWQIQNRDESAESGAIEPPPIGGRHQRIASYAALASLAVVLVVAGFLLFQGSIGRPQPVDTIATTPIDSVAVLPFENVAQDVNAEYLSDGITESLINKLSQLSNLKVVSRSTVFRYKGKEQDTNSVAKELNVRAVLTGSVKRIDDQIIIMVRLDDTQNDRQIWGEQYIRKHLDILDLQNEIARDASTNLRLVLTDVDRRHLAKRNTDNVEAYQLYLKGNYKWEKHTREDLQQAIDYYTEAIEKDPNYALAYSGLANCYSRLGNSYLPPREAYPLAKAHASKALELDNSLVEAHASIIAIKLFYDRDWAGAEDAINRALMINPNYAHLHDMYAVYLNAMGRPDAALAETKRALEIDPLSLQMNTAVGEDLYYARRYDEAIEQLEKTLELDRLYYRAYLCLGHAYDQKEMYSHAISTFQKGLTQAQRHPQLVSSLGRSYALAGERANAVQALEELREMSKERYISPFLFAVIHLGLGDKEQALAGLEKADQDRAIWLTWLKVDPRFDSLRDDPRFRDLVSRIGPDP